MSDRDKILGRIYGLVIISGLLTILGLISFLQSFDSLFGVFTLGCLALTALSRLVAKEVEEVVSSSKLGSETD